MYQANKIYYKGNPYTRNNYIPACANGNRKKQSYLVEFPRGEQFFPHAGKKQYVGLRNQSEIRDKNALASDDQKHYSHGPLQTADIEGARPNTLLSQAIKNRLKAQNNQYHGNLLENHNLLSLSGQKQRDIYHSPHNDRFNNDDKFLGNKYSIGKNIGNNQKINQIGKNFLLFNNRERRNNNSNFHYTKNNRTKTTPNQQIDQERVQPLFKSRIYRQNLYNLHDGKKQQSQFHQNQQKLYKRNQTTVNQGQQPSSYRHYKAYNSDKKSIQKYSSYGNLQEFKKQQIYKNINLSAKKFDASCANQDDNHRNQEQKNHEPEQIKNNEHKRYYSNPNAKNPEDIRKMWHGDIHRIRLIPLRQIRKANPTYLSHFSNSNPEQC